MSRAKLDIRIERPTKRWWTDPDLVVSIFEEGVEYVVAVEIRRDADGAPFVSGVAVRPKHPGGGDRRTVSAQVIRRRPLAKVLKAALAAAATVDDASIPDGEWVHFYDPGDDPKWRAIAESDDRESAARAAVAARKVLVPRGRPQRGRSTGFYKEIARAHRQFSLDNRSPVKAIATRKRVSENTVHQWIHRARKLGFLEPSPRSTNTKEDTDA